MSYYRVCPVCHSDFVTYFSSDVRCPRCRVDYLELTLRYSCCVCNDEIIISDGFVVYKKKVYCKDCFKTKENNG